MILRKFEFLAAAFALGLSCATSGFAQASGGQIFHPLPGSPGAPTNAAPPPSRQVERPKGKGYYPPPKTEDEAVQLYLDHRIGAIMMQKYIAEIRSRPAPPPPIAVQPAPLPPPIATQPPTAQRPPVPNSQPPAAAGQPKNDQISAVEAKMDELIKKKEAREKATNTPPPVATGPKSKRERLNDLLRLYIDGKISEEEMKERRAKILAEP